MKIMIRAFLLFSITLIITGCNDNDYGIQNASTQEIQKMIDKQETGFIIITNETEASFLDEAQTSLLEKRQNALLFNVFYNDGENKNIDGLSKNPFSFNMPTVNTMYYIKDGEVFKEFDLERYTGLDQQNELNHFLETTSRGNQYE